MKAQSLLRRAGVAAACAVLTTLALALPAGAGELDTAFLEQPADVAFTTPTITVVLPDLDGGPPVCTYDLTGSGRISRPAGGSTMTERGTVRGTTNCPKNLTAMLTITDSATGQTAHRATCQGSGFKAASCSTSQSVSYFSSAILTRPVSTVVFKYQLFTGTQERMCFEYRVNMVGGTEGTHGAGPCGGSTI